MHHQQKAFDPKSGVVESSLRSHPVYKALWMPMIDTADLVAERYGISREKQARRPPAFDEYSLISQQRTAEAQKKGLFDDEIVPLPTKMLVKDKETGKVFRSFAILRRVSEQDYVVTKDECNRSDTTLEGLASLKPVNLDKNPKATVTAGCVVCCSCRA
eukprot:318891-Hanusia_phi.AAC.2